MKPEKILWKKNWSIIRKIIWEKQKSKKKKTKRNRSKITDCLDPRKTKMVVEFNDRQSGSIKSFAVKKKEVK